MTHPELDIRADLAAEPWTDLPDHGSIQHGAITRLGVLPEGTVENHPLLVMLVTLDNGGLVIAELPYALAEVARAVLAEAWPPGE